MTLLRLLQALAPFPSAPVRFLLPEGKPIPAHFHITEVGHVTKRFIDCGGQKHGLSEICLLQTWVGDDLEHKLRAGRLATILRLGEKILPSSDLEMEVEYDDGDGARQFRIASAAQRDGRIDLQLASKHTACLAKERRETAGACCA